MRQQAKPDVHHHLVCRIPRIVTPEVAPEHRLFHCPLLGGWHWQALVSVVDIYIESQAKKEGTPVVVERASNRAPAFCDHLSIRCAVIHTKRYLCASLTTLATMTTLFRTYILFATLMFITVSPLSAQHFSLGGNFTVGVPQGEFYEGLDGALGFGVSAHFLYYVPNTPVAVGFDGGFLVYGSERSELNHPLLSHVYVVTTNNYAHTHFVMRAEMPAGAFKPYVDGLIGLSYLFTSSRAEYDHPNNHEPPSSLPSTTNQFDLAFSYGGSAGFLLQLTEWTEQSGSTGRLFLDLKIRYLFGGEAEYLRRGTAYDYVDGLIPPERSKTNILLPQIGLTVQF